MTRRAKKLILWSVGIVFVAGILTFVLINRRIDRSFDQILEYFSRLPVQEKTLPPQFSNLLHEIYESDEESITSTKCFFLLLEERIMRKVRNPSSESFVTVECSGSLPFMASRIVHNFQHRHTKEGYTMLVSELIVDRLHQETADQARALMFAHFFSMRRSLNEASVHYFDRSLTEISCREFLQLLATEEIGEIEAEDLSDEVFADERLRNNHMDIDQRIARYEAMIGQPIDVWCAQTSARKSD